MTDDHYKQWIDELKVGGHDLADIAGRLETDVVVLVDLIDEFGED